MLNVCGRIENLKAVKVCAYASNIRFLNCSVYLICNHPQQKGVATKSRINCPLFKEVEENVRSVDEERRPSNFTKRTT